MGGPEVAEANQFNAARPAVFQPMDAGEETMQKQSPALRVRGSADQPHMHRKYPRVRVFNASRAAATPATGQPNHAHCPNRSQPLIIGKVKDNAACLAVHGVIVVALQAACGTLEADLARLEQSACQV